MSQRSETLKQFGKYMRGTQAGLSSWINPTYYPLELTLVKGAIVGKDFFVDVSRRIGHDLQELCRVYPHLPERLFLQDQAGVIQEAKALYPHIQVMSHDFFTPQPIQGQLPFTSPSPYNLCLTTVITITGARACYLDRVLHEWPVQSCLNILEPLKDAITPGYSRPLINENKISNRGAKVDQTGLNILMMCVAAGCRRTESGWRTLHWRGGFKILTIWIVQEGSESLIEAELR